MALAGPAAPVSPLLTIQEQFRPYEFGYDFADGLGVYRSVEYTAGADGYKAVVRSNEPGTSNHAVGDAVYIVELPPPAVVAQGLRAAIPVPKVSV
ncbi:hypothetical protein CEXT_167751 [Caerostris extrusa]|uniref:Cuticle protein n=1 Tax=Caerostris extrusa TaxID=172846 RepID=A0AAV4MKN8_CAEEX|nr:hypothetical protein CEXT_167751 [Caerostris extrusa]